jgi:peptidyl-prolyl cis-trans isomerase C
MSAATHTKVGDDVAVVRELLRQRAVALGLCTSSGSGDEVAAAIETVLDREVSVPRPTGDECRRWYDAHPDTFVAGELVLARHILFAVTPRTPIEPLRRKAEETLLELRRCPERFDERARELSNCPSGMQGGTLGQLVRGESVPEFERAIFGSAVVGVLPTLVNTRFGFHVVAVDRRVPGHRVPFEAVQGEVAARMSRQAWQRALAQYVRVLMNQAGASVGDRQAASPLVQ